MLQPELVGETIFDILWIAIPLLGGLDMVSQIKSNFNDLVHLGQVTFVVQSFYAYRLRILARSWVIAFFIILVRFYSRDNDCKSFSAQSVCFHSIYYGHYRRNIAIPLFYFTFGCRTGRLYYDIFFFSFHGMFLVHIPCFSALHNCYNLSSFGPH